MKHVVLLVALAACSRQKDVTLTSATLDASAAPPVTELARAWDRAMSQRDLTLLGPLYADEVTFYDVPLRRDQVIRVQSDAFMKDPSFTEKLLSVRATSPTRVEMKREWFRFGKKQTGTVWLEGERAGDQWLVTAEGARAPTGDFCDQLATDVALSTGEAKALVEGPPDHVRAVLAATPPEFPGYGVALIAQANGAPATAEWIDVEPCTFYSPGPNVKTDPGACVPPGLATGAVTNVFTGAVLGPDPKLVTQLSKCR